MERFSSDAFSCSTVKISIRKAATRDSGTFSCKVTFNDLIALWMRRKEIVLRHKSEFSSATMNSLSSRLSSVSFILSPLFIAVHSDSSIACYIDTFRDLSPVFFSKAEKTGDKSALVQRWLLHISERSRNVEFDGSAVATALESAWSSGNATLMCDTDAFVTLMHFH
jgi:hypothetical protein